MLRLIGMRNREGRTRMAYEFIDETREQMTDEEWVNVNATSDHLRNDLLVKLQGFIATERHSFPRR
jgi:hypothetical protein